MFTPGSLLEGKQIDDPAGDFRSAKRIEQYRVSERALYIPSGLRWTYIPLSEICELAESQRVVSAGKCVSVVEHRPVLEVRTAQGAFTLNLEKTASMEALLRAVRPSG